MTVSQVKRREENDGEQKKLRGMGSSYVVNAYLTASPNPGCEYEYCPPENTERGPRLGPSCALRQE
jgi:hypothetical protein